METMCIKCQIPFSGKNKKIITNLSSDEFAQRVVKVITYMVFNARKAFLCLHSESFGQCASAQSGKGPVCRLQKS